MVQSWIEALPEKTGRSLEKWIALVKEEGPKDEAARREWLKKEHGLGTNSAWWIAERAAGRGMEDGDPAAYLKADDRYVEEQHAGKKAALRPICDRLLRLGLSIGKDVKTCRCQTIVPLYRAHVFAQIKPSTNTRVDLGLALKDRITRRIAIASVAEIDAEVEKWLRKAYEMDGRDLGLGPLAVQSVASGPSWALPAVARGLRGGFLGFPATRVRESSPPVG